MTAKQMDSNMWTIEDERDGQEGAVTQEARDAVAPAADDSQENQVADSFEAGQYDFSGLEGGGNFDFSGLTDEDVDATQSSAYEPVGIGGADEAETPATEDEDGGQSAVENKKNGAELLKNRLELSDKLEKMTKFIMDETEGDEQHKEEYDEAAKANDFLLNHTSAFTEMDDADLSFFANRIQKRYDEASKRRGHLDVAWDAFKRGHSSIMSMIVQGAEALKPGEMTQDDVDVIRGAQKDSNDAEILAPKKIGGIENMHSVGDFIDYALETTGENAERMALGTAGAIAGAFLLPALGVPVGVASAIGAGVFTLAGNTGEAVSDQLEENRDDGDIRKSRAYALAQGIGYSILDGAFGISKFAGKIWSGLLRKAGLKAASETATVEGIKEMFNKATLKGAAKELGKATVFEGGQEMMQSQGVGRGVRYFQTGSIFRKNEDGTYETPGDAFLEAANEFAGGATAALTLGLLGGASSYADARRASRISHSIQNVLKGDKTYQQLPEYAKLLVDRHLRNDSFLATEGFINEDVKKSLNDSNAEIDKEIDDLSKNGTPAEKAMAQSARAYLDIFKSQYSLEGIDNIFGVDEKTGEFVSRDGKKYTSSVDPAAMMANGKLIADKKTGEETAVEYTNPVKGAEIKVGEMLGKDGKPNGKYIVTNDKKYKTPADESGRVFDSKNEAFDFARRLDAYNQWRKDRMKAKAEMANTIFNNIFGKRGVNLVLVDRPTDHTYIKSGTNASFVSNPKDENGNPMSPTVFLDIGKINSLGDLYTTLVHERSHEDIVEFLLKSRNFYKKVGDKVVPDWEAVEAARLELMAKVKKENGETAEDVSKKFRNKDGTPKNDWGRSAGVAGEELVAERNSVYDIAKRVRDMERGVFGSVEDKIRQAIGVRMAYEMGVSPSAIMPKDVSREIDKIFDLDYIGEEAPAEFKRTSPEWNGRPVGKNAAESERTSSDLGPEVAQTANGNDEITLGTESDDVEETAKPKNQKAAKPKNLKPQMKNGDGKAYANNANIRRADGTTFTKVGTSDGSYSWKNLDTNELVNDEIASDGGYEEIYDEKKASETATSPKTGENSSQSAPKEKATTSSPEAAKPAEGGKSASTAAEAQAKPAENQNSVPKTDNKAESKEGKKPAKVNVKPEKRPVNAENQENKEPSGANLNRNSAQNDEKKPEKPKTTQKKTAKTAEVSQKPAETEKMNLRDLIGATKKAIDLIVKGKSAGNDLFVKVENDAKRHFAEASDSALAGEIAILQKNDENSSSGPHHALLGMAYDEQNRRKKEKEAETTAKTETPAPTDEENSQVAAPQNNADNAQQTAPKETPSTNQPKAAKPAETPESRPAKETPEPIRVNPDDTLTVEQGKAEAKPAQTVDSNDKVTFGFESDTVSDEHKIVAEMLDRRFKDSMTKEQKDTILKLVDEYGDVTRLKKIKGTDVFFLKLVDSDDSFCVKSSGDLISIDEAFALSRGKSVNNDVSPMARAKSIFKMHRVLEKDAIQLSDDVVKGIGGMPKRYAEMSDDQLLALRTQKKDFLALKELWDRWSRDKIPEWLAKNDKNHVFDVDDFRLDAWIRIEEAMTESDRADNDVKILMEHISQLPESIRTEVKSSIPAALKNGSPLGRTVTASAMFYDTFTEMLAEKNADYNAKQGAKLRELDERIARWQREEAARNAAEEKRIKDERLDKETAIDKDISLEEAKALRVARETGVAPEEYTKMPERELMRLCVPHDGEPADPLAQQEAKNRILYGYEKDGKHVGGIDESKLIGWINNKSGVSGYERLSLDIINDTIAEIEADWENEEKWPFWLGDKESNGLVAYATGVAGNMIKRKLTDIAHGNLHAPASLDEMIDRSRENGRNNDNDVSDKESWKRENGLYNDDESSDDNFYEIGQEFADENEKNSGIDWYTKAKEAIDSIMSSGVLSFRQKSYLWALKETWRRKVEEAKREFDMAIKLKKRKDYVDRMGARLRKAYLLEFDTDEKNAEEYGVLLDAAEKVGMKPLVYAAKLNKLLDGIAERFMDKELVRRVRSGLRVSDEEAEKVRKLSRGKFTNDEVVVKLANIHEDDREFLFDYDDDDIMAMMKANGDEVMAFVVKQAIAGKTDGQIQKMIDNGKADGFRMRDRSLKADTLLDHAYEDYGWIDMRVKGKAAELSRLIGEIDELEDKVNDRWLSWNKREEADKKLSAAKRKLATLKPDVSKRMFEFVVRVIAHSADVANLDRVVTVDDLADEEKSKEFKPLIDRVGAWIRINGIDTENVNTGKIVSRAILSRAKPFTKKEQARINNEKRQNDHAVVAEIMAGNGNDEAKTLEVLKRSNTSTDANKMIKNYRSVEKDLEERAKRDAERDRKARENGKLSEEQKREAVALFSSLDEDYGRLEAALMEAGLGENLVKQAVRHVRNATWKDFNKRVEEAKNGTYEMKRDILVERLGKTGRDYIVNDAAAEYAFYRLGMSRDEANEIISEVRRPQPSPVTVNETTEMTDEELAERTERTIESGASYGIPEREVKSLTLSMDREDVEKARAALAKAEKELADLGKGAPRDFNRVQDRLNVGMDEKAVREDLHYEGLSDKKIDSVVARHGKVVEANAKIAAAKDALANAEDRLERDRDEQSGVRYKTITQAISSAGTSLMQNGSVRYKTNPVDNGANKYTGLSDPSAGFAAEESLEATGFGRGEGRPRKVRSVLDRQARDLIAKDPLMLETVSKIRNGGTPSDVEIAALNLRLRQMQYDAINGNLDADLFQKNEENMSTLVETLRAGKSEAGAALQATQAGVDMRTLDMDVYMLAETKAKFKKEVEKEYGVGSVDEHGAELKKALEEKSGRIKEMSSELQTAHDELDKANAELAKVHAKAEDDAIEAYRRGVKQGERQATEAEKKRRLDAISNAFEKYGAIKERAGIGVDSADVIADIFGAAKRFAGNPKSALTEQMRNGFAGVLYMFDGDADKARKYLSDKIVDFKEKVEPMFNAYLAEEEKAAKPKDGTVKEKRRIVKERIHKRAETAKTKIEERRRKAKDTRERLRKSAEDADVRTAMSDTEEQALANIGEFARAMFKVFASENPDVSTEIIIKNLVERMNNLYKRYSKDEESDRFDVQDAKDAILGKGEFKPVTKERAKVELARLLNAKKLIAENRVDEASKEAGLRVESDAEVLQELDRRIGSLLNSKLNRLEERIDESDENTDGLRREIHDLIMALHDIRSGKPVGELLDRYLDLAIGMKDYRKRRSLLEQIESRIAMYEKKLKDNDFETVPNVSAPDDAEELKKVAAAKRHLESRRERFKRERSAWKLRRGPWLHRQFGSLLELLGEVKAIAGSMDLSAVLRQGGQMTLAHPIYAFKSFKMTLEALKDEKKAEEIMDEIAARPNYHYYLEAGIDFTDYGDNAANAEDLYILNKYRIITRNRLMKWGINASERAFVTYLNLMRANVFDAMVANSPMREAKNLSKRQLHAMGDFVNVISQRGAFDKSGKLGKALEVLNGALWSPRNLISRAQFIWNTLMLAVPGMKYYGISGDMEMRKMFARETARYAVGVAAVIFFAKMMSDLLRDDDEPPTEIVFDPKSSDFLKVKIGNTRLDFLSGLQQVFVFGWRMWTGEKTHGNGNTVKKDRGEMAFRFARTKFSPMAGIIYDLFTREDFDKRDISFAPMEQLTKNKDTIGVTRYIANSIFVPLIANDVIEQAEDSIGRLPATFVLSALGAGVQTYDSFTYKAMKQDYQYFKRLWKAAETKEERDRLQLYHPMLKNMGALDMWIKSVNNLERNLKKLEKSGSRPSDLNTIVDEIDRRRKIVVNLMTGAKNPTQVE